MTGEASDIQKEDATSLLASLDRANAAMRVVSMGDTVGPQLAEAARGSGGAAAPVGWGSDPAEGGRRPEHDVRRAVPVAGHDARAWSRHRPPGGGRAVLRGDDPRRRRGSDDHPDHLDDLTHVDDVGARDGPGNRTGPTDDGAWRANELWRGIIDARRRGWPRRRRHRTDRRRGGGAAQTQPAPRRCTSCGQPAEPPPAVLRPLGGGDRPGRVGE